MFRPLFNFGVIILFFVAACLPVPAQTSPSDIVFTGWRGDDSDFDGDGKTDLGMYRNGVWYMQRSQQGFGAVQFGATNDRPIPAAFVP